MLLRFFAETEAQAPTHLPAQGVQNRPFHCELARQGVAFVQLGSDFCWRVSVCVSEKVGVCKEGRLSGALLHHTTYRRKRETTVCLEK